MYGSGIYHEDCSTIDSIIHHCGLRTGNSPTQMARVRCTCDMRGHVLNDMWFALFIPPERYTSMIWMSMTHTGWSGRSMSCHYRDFFSCRCHFYWQALWIIKTCPLPYIICLIHVWCSIPTRHHALTFMDPSYIYRIPVRETHPSPWPSLHSANARTVLLPTYMYNTLGLAIGNRYDPTTI